MTDTPTGSEGSGAGHFAAIYERGFTNLVSVIPPGAALASGSGIDPAKLGKIPGLRSSNGRWYGYGFITAPTPDRATVEQWERDGANLGLLGKYNPAIDIDCDDAEVARRVEEVALRFFGPMPARYGRKPRLLLVGRTERPFNKRSLAFSLRSAPCSEYKIEVLANRQQYLIAGRHPAGMLYTWKGKTLAEVASDELPLLSVKSVEAFLDAVQAEFGDDFALTERGTSGDSSKTPPQESLRGDLEEMRAMVTALPNHFPDRDTYVRVAIAVKAALWDHPSEAFELFFDWAIRWTEGTNSPEEIEKLWASLKPPFRIGAQWLRDMLRRHNHAAAGALLGTKFSAVDAVEHKVSSMIATPGELVAQSGLAMLSTGTPMREIGPRIQQVAAGLEGATVLDRELVRSELVIELRRIGVPSPTRVVDAALPRQAATEDGTNADGLTNAEPWPEAVSTAAMLDEVMRLLRKYVVLPEAQALAVALWALHTYAVEATDYTPYLWVSSPVRECGKSTLLDLLSHLAYRAQFTGGITAAALYRRIARLSPTMLLDELDTRLRSDGAENLRSVLNTGFHRTGRMTICVGEDHHEEDFATFCPKVLAGIGFLWDTVTSRSIPIRMERASKEELKKVARIRGDRIGDECSDTRRRLMRWKNDIGAHLRERDPAVPEALGARQGDVWRPLLAIAETAGEAFAERARQAAVTLHRGHAEEGDLALLLLADVRDLLETKPAHAILTAIIVSVLGAREDRPWCEYRGKDPITPRGVATLLGRFGIKVTTVRVGSDRGKGYRAADLAPMFEKYLSQGDDPPPSVTSVTPVDPAGPVAVAAASTGTDEDAPHLKRPLDTAPPLLLVTDVTDSPDVDDDPRILEMLLGNASPTEPVR